MSLETRISLRKILRWLISFRCSNAKGETKNFYCISLEFFFIHGRLCRDSIVSIVTSYVFDGPRFELLWKRDFLLSTSVETGLEGSTSLRCHGYWNSFPGVQQLGCGIDHTPPRLRMSRGIPLLSSLCHLWHVTGDL
jgi:hypothetical protein